MNEPMWTDVWSTWASIISAVVAIGAVVGVFMVRSQIILQRRQMHHELENLYVDRYWTIIDRLDECEPADSPEAAVVRRRALAAYLRLSEDECDLRERDRVTDETWAIWRDGIVSGLKIPGVAPLIDDWADGELTHLRRLQNDSTYDPSASADRQRRKHGLIV